MRAAGQCSGTKCHQGEQPTLCHHDPCRHSRHCRYSQQNPRISWWAELSLRLSLGDSPPKLASEPCSGSGLGRGKAGEDRLM